jgi:ribonucleoside-diphosphate reductase alpha chain
LLSSLGKKIFLDRYAKKDDNFAAGDEVLAIHGGESGCTTAFKGQSVLGTVVSVSQNSVELKLESGETILDDKSNVAKPCETLEMMFQRVSDAVASAEENNPLTPKGSGDKEKWTCEFFQLLSDLKFIPGGRILSAAGNENLTYYNCFVLPSPKDCREGIIETLQQMVDIMSRGGGVGINISSLRPKDIPVRGVSGRSSGAVSWGALYSFATGLICQGGSRRGALGLVMNDWHPDLLEFVSCKRKEGGAFSNANISVAISDDFMKALEKDSSWQLVFPDTSHPDYDKKWDGSLQTWINAGYPVLTHKTIKAQKLWGAIVENAWANGEPGIWFIDKANTASNSHYLGRLNCTNPCFEEPLPAFGVCCLGSLNLPAFINGNDIAWEEFSKAIKTAVRFLDDVIDVTPYFHDEIEQLQKSERRIGLGTMGLAEVLIRLGLCYGSDESLEFIDKLYGFIAKTAYLASVSLAKEKGRFPAYTDDFLFSGFMMNMPKEVRDEVAKYGIRNMTLLTQAPTGSTATMVGTSTGIEPFFDFRYTRKSQLGEAIGRLISLIFRLEPIPPKERALQIIEQLSGIGGAQSVGFGKNKVLSLPDAVSKALAEHYELQLSSDAASYKNNPDIRDGVDSIRTHFKADICPVCGQSSYVREEGCVHCLSCGFSEC